MKELKDKEIIIGLVIIIVLGAIALFLLIKREFGHSTPNESINAEEMMEEEIPQEVVSLPEFSNVSVEVSEESAKQETTSSQDAVSSNQETANAEKDKMPNGKKSSLYTILGESSYKPATYTQRKIEDGQLKELFEYWDAYKLDAVADLVRLERIQEISEELKGTGHFYYYGSFDKLGRPSGKGLAVYENNTFYCGDWKDGLRHGKGMWLQVAIYDETNQNSNLGLVEHSYNGQWSKDLPNGQGQEHFSYDFDVLKEESLKDGFVIANVIGGFKDGYYDGEMYIMTVDDKGNSKDWTGKCKKGVWEIMVAGNTTHAVWSLTTQDESGNTIYHYMFPKENKNFGIIGLKK